MKVLILISLILVGTSASAFEDYQYSQAGYSALKAVSSEYLHIVNFDQHLQKLKVSAVESSDQSLQQVMSEMTDNVGIKHTVILVFQLKKPAFSALRQLIRDQVAMQVTPMSLKVDGSSVNLNIKSYTIYRSVGEGL